ncbi:transporter substrate-binding domain-containing protein [Actinokineospora diospyrosa]|uniref:Polar amino acid transport system substrate-binding protein n=1 Tax=Actinokineospora diospyrosa TaxID=103728 RepID=A0ABT1I976_9PSEU|nr:transporter substrate-binding domain-containing protein [Actinokineospora diospyrosa]MCP2269188.1 polar amino acid transport system substrate-binding protein [Actinokineospora diospyrosa]
MPRSLLIAAVCLLASACVSVRAATVPTGSAEPGVTVGSGQTVRVAVFNNYPPAEFTADGRLTGWMIEFLEPIARETGLRMDIVPVNNFSTIIPGLQSGRFDIAAANLTVSAERVKIIDMVTVDAVGTGFSAAADSGVAIRSGRDVCGKAVAALAGSVYEPQLRAINDECAAAGLPAARTSLYPDSSAAVLAAGTRRADVFMGSYSEVVHSARESGQLTVQPYQFARLPEAIGFPKGSPHTEKVRAAVNKLIAGGQYRALLAKWGMAEIAVTESQLNPEVP